MVKNFFIMFLVVASSLFSQQEKDKSNTIANLTNSLTITQLKATAPGSYLISPNIPNVGNFISILDSSGKVLRSSSFTNLNFDFKFNRNGLLSSGDVYLRVVGGFGLANINMFDKNLNLVSTEKAKYQYRNGFHDFLVLRNGNYLHVTYEPSFIDASGFAKGGRPDASFVNVGLQEVNPKGEVVFSWNAVNTLPINTTYNDLKNPGSYAHLNAVTEDYDGNFIISLRHTSSLLKINRATGETMWTMGGKKNEFKFIGFARNDSLPFSYQHHITALGRNRYLLFNNGNQYAPQISSVQLFSIDEAKKEALLYKEIKHPNNLFTVNQGSAQLLPNGNFLVGWGGANTSSTYAFTEFDSNGEILLEGYLPVGTANYRVSKVNLNECDNFYRSINTEVKGDETIKGNRNGRPFYEMEFSDIKGFMYNKVELNYSTCFFNRPNFEKRDFAVTPNIVGGYFRFQNASVDSYKATMKLYLNQLDYIANPSDLRLYVMSNNDSLYKLSNAAVNFNPSDSSISFALENAKFFLLGSDVKGFNALVNIESPINNELLSTTRDYQFKWNVVGQQYRFKTTLKNTNTGENFTFADTSSIATTKSIRLTKAGNYIFTVEHLNHTTTFSTFASASFTVKDDELTVINPEELMYLNYDTLFDVRWKSNIPPNYRVTLKNLDRDSVVLKRDSLQTTTQAIQVKIEKAYPAGRYRFIVEAYQNDKVVANSADVLIGIPASVEFTKESNLIKSVIVNDNVLKIELQSFIGNAKAMIVDLSGRVVLQNIEFVNPTNEIDISQFNQGAYLLKIIANDSGDVIPFIISR